MTDRHFEDDLHPYSNNLKCSNHLDLESERAQAGDLSKLTALLNKQFKV